MNIEFTNSFNKKAQQLSRKNPQFHKALKKQLFIFTENTYHPSLRIHKLKGKRSEQLAIWIKGDLRALLIKSKSRKNTYIFFDLVTHDEY